METPVLFPLPQPQKFPPGGVSAAQVPLLQVFPKDAVHLPAHFLVQSRQPGAHILMNGRFAHAELSGTGAHRSAGFQNMLRRLHHPQPHIIPHMLIPFNPDAPARLVQAMPMGFGTCPC